MKLWVAGVCLLAALPGCRAGADIDTVQANADVMDCGSYRQERPDQPPIPDAGLECFVDAMHRGRPARLEAATLTIEGGYVYSTFTTREEGIADVLSDLRGDPFGGKRVQRERCSGPEPANGYLRFTTCSPPDSASAPAASR